MDLDSLQRSFFDAVYTYRIEVAIAMVALAIALLVVGRQRGWFAAARRHPARAGALVVVLVAIVAPVGYYAASPLWIRTELVEPDPVAIVRRTQAPVTSPMPARAAPVSSPTEDADGTAAATAFAPRTVKSGAFHGTDDFHFGRGKATIIETAPGRFTLRLEAFSVRNGPDLFVYLSPVADDYAAGALEIGRLKATDGAFGYELPGDADPAQFDSAIVWCKQFSHLFAVAPLAAI